MGSSAAMEVLDAVRREYGPATDWPHPPPMGVIKASRGRGLQTWSPWELRDFLYSTREHELQSLWCVLTPPAPPRFIVMGPITTGLQNLGTPTG